MVLQIRHPIRRIAASAFVAFSLSSSAFSQEGCVTAAAAPVVDTVQELRDYVGSIWHASEPLAVKKQIMNVYAARTTIAKQTCRA